MVLVLDCWCQATLRRHLSICTHQEGGGGVRVITAFGSEEEEADGQKQTDEGKDRGGGE